MQQDHPDAAERPQESGHRVWIDDRGAQRSDPVIADWWFTHFAYRRLPEVMPGVDADASRLIMRLRRASGILSAVIHHASARHGTATLAGQRILFTLALAGPLSQAQVADLSGMSKAAVSSAVRTLIADGLVTRTRDDGDRRAVRLSLTDAGRHEQEDDFRARNEAERAIAAALSPEELSSLMAVLERLMAFAADHGGGAMLDDSQPVETVPGP